MNDYYYYTLILPFLKKEERTICTKRDRYLIGLKNKRKKLLLAHVYLHAGSPCGRYCICRYFDNNDVLDLYKDYCNR